MVHFNKREEQCLVQSRRKRNTADRPREENGRKERGGVRLRWGMGKKGPMVLPYGKSPPAMVNACVIGGRYAGLLREAKSNDELF